MSKLHELLAAERTPMGAWNTVLEETMKKFKGREHYFEGYARSLKMIEDSEANRNLEDQSNEDKPVPTTVKDTLEYAFKIFSKAEKLQCQKNATNALARGHVMWKGEPLLSDLPVDELLGLEARLAKIQELFAMIPTLDATKYWSPDEQQGDDVWAARSEESTKTEKQVVPIVLSEATEHHPAQVQAISKDIVVGKFTIIRRSGAVTAEQKARMLETIDDLLVEVKSARMRANETEVVDQDITGKLVDVLMEPLR